MVKKAFSASVVAFFSELSKQEYNPIKDRAVEIELLKSYLVDHNNEAFDTLVKKNLRYVVRVAMKYMDRGDHDIDVLHAGVIGLMTAIRRYDLNSYCKLITYARNWIKYEIEQCVRSKSTVKLTNYMSWRSGVIEEVIENLRKAGQSHTDEAVSSVAGISEKGVVAARTARKSQYVIDHPFDSGVAYRAVEVAGEEPIDSLIKSEDRDRLYNALDVLDNNESFVIRRLFFDDDGIRETYRSLAGKMGCSHEQVRKLQLSAFDKIALALA